MKVYILALPLILTLNCSKKNAPIENSTVADNKSSDTVSLRANRATAAIDEKFININDNDTINANGFTLIFSAYGSTLIPSIYLDQKIREEITDTIANSHLAAIAVEKYLASTSNDYFQGNDSELTLFFQNGKIQGLPRWNPKDEVGYYFNCYFAKENYYLIFKQYYEGTGWVLFNRKNGSRQDIMGTPYFSPSGHRVIAVSASFAYNPNGFELLTVSNDSLVREFRVEVANWGPVSAKWLSENEIVMKTVDPSGPRGYLLLRIK